MATYLFRRLLLVVPTFLGITIVVFCITRLVPGGPVEKMISQMQAEGGVKSGASRNFGGGVLNEEQLAQLNSYYGFDKPILVSYKDWLVKLVHFDLGDSTRYGEPVWETIKSRLPISAFYGIITLLLTYLVCVPLGIFKAIKHGRWPDHASSVLIFIGYALPSYVVAIILLIVFGARLEWFPLGGFVSENFSDLTLSGKAWDLFQHAAMPLVAYMVGSFAVMTLLMKNSLLEHMSADFMRTAIAKGVSFKDAVRKHALQNSLIPIATHFGNNISVIIAGSFFIEKIFNIDGFGLLGYEAVVERDYPVVMGILVISAFLQLAGNILSDICVALVDPRVSFK